MQVGGSQHGNGGGRVGGEGESGGMRGDALLAELRETLRGMESRMEEQVAKVKADVADMRREMRQGQEELSEQLSVLAAHGAGK